jgi:hypothetical protein
MTCKQLRPKSPKYCTLVQYGYDTASRLQNVTNGNAKITYTYLATSPLVGQSGIVPFRRL